MRMRRLSLAMVFVLPIGLLAAGFATLALAEPSRQLAEPSGCAMDLRKWVEPESLVLGETAQVSLLVSSTCPTRYLPVDLIIVADESNSMIRAKRIADRPTPGEPTKEATPNPSAGPPTKPPTEPSSGGDPGGTPPISGGRGSEPPFCKPSGGSVREPTEGPPTKPPTRDPETPEPPEPPSTPGPITTPGGNPIVDPPPTPIDIEDLEPSGGTDWVREEKSWIRDFMTQPEIERDVANGRLRVGFVSFNERARIRQPLTTEVSKIFSASTKMRGGEVTYPQTAIRAAEQMLRGGGSRKDVERVQIILLMSDFQFCQKDVRRADKDIKVIGVGFGVRSYDLRKMYDLVNERAYAFTQHRDLRGVIELYEDVVAKGSAVGVADLTVRDKVSDNIAILSGPIDPPTVTITGQLLEWSFVDPVLPMTLSYAIEPLDAGLLPVSQEAGVDWRDSETLLGGSTFPTVTIEVLAPTPTPTNTPTITPSPTATDTPTATHTPTPAPQFFPIALREKAPPTVTPVPSPTECVPSSQLVDVALVIDTSTSMNESTRTGGTRKLDAAIDAGIALVELLKDTDQSTVVWFNSNAGVSAQLTTDKSAAIAALRALPSTTASGTAMHLGIRAATDELTSSRHNPNANRSLILLTDGYQSHPDGLDVVYQAATAAKQAGILVVTVGLGLDVDHAMLTDVASEPTLFFHAPNAEDLEAIYITIADLIPCR